MASSRYIYVLFHWLWTLWPVLSTSAPLIVDLMASSQYMCLPTDYGPYGQFLVHVLFHWLWTLWPVPSTLLFHRLWTIGPVLSTCAREIPDFNPGHCTLLCLSGGELDDLAVVLGAMSAPDLRTLAKSYHFNPMGQQKGQIILALVAKSQQSTVASLFGQKVGGVRTAMLKRWEAYYSQSFLFYIMVVLWCCFLKYLQHQMAYITVATHYKWFSCVNSNLHWQ